ncbi:hypothetical protein AB2M62_00115 [Sphingomonas sp. MMS12-HWE2-04]|uniref:hypothetical protein n=1 Tax=Sphingomonas sp. MMS12-HWE2-04 TaxID=3234199 RepID=UPI00384B6B76
MRSLLPAAMLALASLTACSGAKNEAAEANETLGGDSNAMGEAVADVNAANAATEAAISPADAPENGSAGNAAFDESAEGGNEITD